MSKCQDGVCVTVDDVFYSVSPETVDEFLKIKSKRRCSYDNTDLRGLVLSS